MSQSEAKTSESLIRKYSLGSPFSKPFYRVYIIEICASPKNQLWVTEEVQNCCSGVSEVKWKEFGEMTISFKGRGKLSML